MNEEKDEREHWTPGMCRYNMTVGCYDIGSRCAKCGWNPHNGVREQRIARYFEENRRRARRE